MSTARILNAALGLGLIGYAISDHPMYGGGPGFGGTQAAIAGVGGVLLLIAALPPLQRHQGNVLMLTLVSLGMLALTEVVATKAIGPLLRAPYDYDERLLFKLHPSSTSVRPRHADNGGGTVSHSINSLGFRGPELDAKHSKPRIMVYGDSFIHATYTAEPETFVRLLEDRLVKGGHDVELVNAGVSSYGPDQILLRLETELAQYQPELLILSVFLGNDYGDLMRNKIFRVGEDGTLQPSPHHVDPEIIQSFEYNRRSSVVVRGIKSIRHGLGGKLPPMPGTTPADQRKLLDEWLGYAQVEYDEHVTKRDPLVRNILIDYYSADLSAQPQGDAGRYKSKLMQLVLARIFELTRAAQVPLVLMAIPHPYDVGADFPYLAIDKAAFPDYDPRNLVEPVVGFARTSSVPVLDVFEVYRAQPDVRPLYLKAGDDHWSPQGQVVAADAMAQLLTERKLVPTAVRAR